MRAIGKEWTKRVKQETKNAVKSLLADYRNGIEDAATHRLPIEMWETWEGADQEIREIITETFDKILDKVSKVKEE